jgi:hypothetical protein
MNTFDNGKERKLPSRPHDIPTPEPLKKFMEQGWAPSPLEGLKKNPVASFAGARRKKLSERFPNKRLIVQREHSKFAATTRTIASDHILLTHG